jgi:hypothetical protein
VNRELYYTALFNLLKSGLPDVKVCERKLVHWSDALVQPAVYLHTSVEHVSRPLGRPPKYTLMPEIYIYAKASDPSVPPIAVLNGFLDEIDNLVFGDDPLQRQTLGGLGGLSHMEYNSTTKTFEDPLGVQVVAVITIKMVIGSF